MEGKGEDVMFSGDTDVEGASKTVKLSELSSGLQGSRRKDRMW